MPPKGVSVSLGANPAGFIAGMRAAGTSAEVFDAKLIGISKNAKLLGGAFIGVEIFKGLKDATKSAADFQTALMRLRTDANESAKNIGMVGKGILNLAGSTGNSVQELAKGMYVIESAGRHGADALLILKAAAEGAKVGQADLTTVSNALTTAMTDYHMPASSAVSVTNELIATVSRGKTNLEALSGSLASVLPAAAASGISLAEVSGAMATMTAQGTPAANAATYLRQIILNLENPTKKARTEMEALGLSSIDISKNLGTRGLTGTLSILSDAITRQLTPAGVVQLAQLAKLGAGTSAYQQYLAKLPPSVQTAVGALANMTGGTKSFQVALELTGQNLSTFKKNVQEIGGSTKGAGSDVRDWSDVQKTLNVQLAMASGAMQKISITLGQELLPPITNVVKKFADFAGWLGKYPSLVSAVTYGLVGAGGLFAGLKVVNGAYALWNGLAVSSIGWRAKQTAAMVAEAAAARAAAGAVGALDVAEAGGLGRAAKVGLLGRLANPGTAAAAVVVGGIVGINALNDSAANRAEQKRAFQTETLHKQDMGFGYGMAGPPPGSNQALGVKGLLDDSAALKAVAAATIVTDATAKNLSQTYQEQVGHLHQVASATAVAAATTRAMNGPMGSIAQAMSKAKDAASGLSAGLAWLSGNAITASRAQDGFQQLLNNFSASLDKHSKTLKGNSNAAIQNRGLIDEMANANLQAGEAVFKSTGSIDKARAALIEQAKALEANTAKTLGSKAAADEFLASIGALPSQLTNAFAGLGAKGKSIGEQLAQGFADGIKSAAPKAFAQASSLAAQSAELMRVGLQTHSPSKVTHKIGVDHATGFAHGIKSGASKAAAEAKALAKAATHALEVEAKAGVKVALAAMSKEISDNKAKLGREDSARSTLRSDQANAMSNAKGVFTATGALSSIVGSQTKNWDGSTTQNAVTAGDINSQLGAMKSADRTFLGDLKALKKAHVAQGIITQILNMGPIAGHEFAQAILGGGASEVKTVNGLESSIGQYGNQAAQMAGAPFTKPINDLTGEMKKLNARLAAEEKNKTKAAAVNVQINGSASPAQIKQLVAEIEKYLGRKVNLAHRAG